MINIKKKIGYLKNIFKIINFNKKYFKKININKKSLILCEFTHNSVSQVSFSYLVNALKKKYNCESAAFIDAIDDNYLKFLYKKILNFFNFSNFVIYKSFQVTKFIFLRTNNKILNQSNSQINDILPKLKIKEDLLKLKIENILVGDLIYDSYLRRYKKATVDLKDKDFISFFEKSIKIFYFWINFFQSNKVEAIIVSHAVYVESIVVRAAIKNNIVCYQCSWDNIFKIDNIRDTAYVEFRHFKNEYKKFNDNQKKNAINAAKKEINDRFTGKKVGDIHILKKTSFHTHFSKERILSKSEKKKILVATHDFSDAPHGYGNIEADIFIDFYEWIKHLNSMSIKTDYEWYIKSHPNCLPETELILKDFIKDKPHLKYISNNISNSQIISEGINCVLTVYGTIGWEYAYFKVPVINATPNNPHISYKFNLNPKSLAEYEDMLLNFEKYKINFDENEIYEFYFMRYIFSRSDWMFNSLNEVTDKIGGYKNLSTKKFYEYWISNFTEEHYSRIENILNLYLNSNEYYIKNYNFNKVSELPN